MKSLNADAMQNHPNTRENDQDNKYIVKYCYCLMTKHNKSQLHRTKEEITYEKTSAVDSFNDKRVENRFKRFNNNST